MINFVFKRGKNYSAKVRMPWETGAPKVISLQTTDQREAQRALDEIIKERFMEQRGELTPRQIRETLTLPISDLVQTYLDDLQSRGRSENTVAKYKTNISKVIGQCHWHTLQDVTAHSFTKWRVKSKLAPKSHKDMQSSVSGFLGWLVRQRRLSQNPLEYVERSDTRLTVRYRRALSEAEQQRLLAVSPPLRAVIYLLVLETGLRRNELNQLLVDDFVFDTPAPFARIRAATTKNKKAAQMRLRPHVVDALKTHLSTLSANSKWALRNRVPRVSTLKRDLLRAGIEFDNEHGRMDLHGLRVTFCTNLLISGNHPRVVQELMRHSDIKLTMRNYTDPSQLPLDTALSTLPIHNIHTQRHAANGS